MNDQNGSNETIARLTDWYGDGREGGSPTAEQWKNVLSRPNCKPLTLINFFKLRAQALYSENSAEYAAAMSGNDAFERYAAVSIPTMEGVGGSFLHVGPFDCTFVGPEADWDIVAIGCYPNIDALLALFFDENYRNAYFHRTAACENQTVLVARN